jgi:hypothetical protein
MLQAHGSHRSHHHLADALDKAGMSRPTSAPVVAVASDVDAASGKLPDKGMVAHRPNGPRISCGDFSDWTLSNVH